MIDPEAQQIIDMIEEAFAGVPRGDVTWHQAVVIDHEWSHPEKEAQAKAMDTEKCWQDVPKHLLRANTYILTYSDLQSWTYYLPAYLRWMVGHWGESDSGSDSATVWLLTLGMYGQDHRNSQLNQFESLTIRQRNTVARVLDYLARRVTSFEGGDKVHQEDAIRALDSYWRQYL